MFICCLNGQCDREADSTSLVNFYNDYGQNFNFCWELDMPMETWDGVILGSDGCVESLAYEEDECVQIFCPSPFVCRDPLFGPFPEYLTTLNLITEIDLSFTSLNGPIPPDIDDLCLLEIFDVGTCLFNGPLTAELSLLENLDFLDLSFNQFTGLYPSEFIALCDIDFISFEGNSDLPNFTTFCESGLGAYQCDMSIESIACNQSLIDSVSLINCNNEVIEAEIGVASYSGFTFEYYKISEDNISTYRFYGCHDLNFETVVQNASIIISTRGVFNQQNFLDISFLPLWECGENLPLCDSNIPEDNDGDGFTITEDCNDFNPQMNENQIESQDNLFDDDCDGNILPRKGFKTEFNDPPNNNISYGFHVDPISEFDFNPALHTNHPYENNANYYYYLGFPLLVSATNPTISFDEVAIVEIGDEGAFNYLDPLFKDYVIVEARKTSDIDYLPLLDGYDSDSESNWLNAYNNNLSGNNTMIRSRTINILESTFFEPGDTIEIKFRFKSNESITAWGWAIDNLEIQLEDADNDGFDNSVDCDDENPEINPGAIEILDNEIDEDCNGIAEISTSTQFLEIGKLQYYPNPTLDNITLLFKENEHLIKYCMYSIEGTIIECNSSLRDNKVLDVSKLIAGVYILKIWTNDGSYSEIIIRN